MSWWAVGAAVAGAAVNYDAAGKATKAQLAGQAQQLAQHREDRNIGLGLVEPNRALGYGATSDLAALYGYKVPEYQSLSELTGGQGPLSVNGRARTSGGGPMDLNTYTGGKPNKLGGTIDPVTGEVRLTSGIERSGKGGKGISKKEALLNEYLRTGEGLSPGKHKKMSRMIKAIDQLRASGYQYDPNAAGAAAAKAEADKNFNPAADRTGGAPADATIMYPGGSATFDESGGGGMMGIPYGEKGSPYGGYDGSGQVYDGPHPMDGGGQIYDGNTSPKPTIPGYDPNVPTHGGNPTAGGPGGDPRPQTMLERIQSMPGYQFGMQQGTRALDQSAAARSGAVSGNASNATMRFGQDYAGSKFNEEFNRLMAMAGLGQVATGSGAGTVAQTGSQMANVYGNMGDSRASGVLGQGNAITGAANTGIGNYMTNKYINSLG